jgi:hypothetical protein
MGIFNIIIGIVLLIISVYATLANISPSQEERQPKAFIAVVMLLIIFLAGIFTSNKHSSYLIGIYIGLGIVWPYLIAFFINRKTIKEPLSYSTPQWSMLIGAFILILMILFFMIPDTVGYEDGKPIIDSYYLVSRASFLFMVLPATVLFILLAFTRTVIYKKGVFHNGLLWVWSDFKDYEWKGLNRNRKEVDIIFKPKSLLYDRKIKLKIQADQKEFITELLAKEVKSS